MVVGGRCGDTVDCHPEQSNSAHVYHIRLLQYARRGAVLAEVCEEVEEAIPIVSAHCPSPQAFSLSFDRR